MSTLDRAVSFTIGEKEYKLQYTIRALINAEKKLTNKSLLVAVSQLPMNINDMFEMFNWGLVGGGYKGNQAEEIYLDYLEEHTYAEMQALVLEALTKSGTIGKVQKN